MKGNAKDGKKKYDKPLKIDMPFEDAMKKIVKVKSKPDTKKKA